MNLLIPLLILSVLTPTLVKVKAEEEQSELRQVFQWNGKLYYISQEEVDADRANEECEKHGYKLLKIEGNKEQEVVQNFLHTRMISGDVWMDSNPILERRKKSVQPLEVQNHTEVQPYTNRCRMKDCGDEDCPPPCNSIPKCNVTLPPCETDTPPCGPVTPTCTANRGNCSATCPPCEVLIPPQCTVTQPPCQVINGKCNISEPICTVYRPPCYTQQRNCTTETKPCKQTQLEVPCPNSASPKCRFVPDNKCVTTPESCVTTPGTCTTTTMTPDNAKCREHANATDGNRQCEDPTSTTVTTCAPPTTTCTPGSTTCNPPFQCDPIVCYKPSTICQKPVTHCPKPVTICPPAIVKCSDPTPLCEEPTVLCPDPIITCSQPLVNCTGPDISCPGVITHCVESLPYCPPPSVTCPDPIIECEEPTPCDPSTQPPPTNPTCPPGYEECEDGEDCSTTPISTTPTTPPPDQCVCLTQGNGYKPEMRRDCNTKRKFICQADTSKKSASMLLSALQAPTL